MIDAVDELNVPMVALDVTLGFVAILGEVELQGGPH